MILAVNSIGEDEASSSTSEPPAKKSKSFFSFEDDDSSTSTSVPQDSNLANEISAYLSERRVNECPLKYWKSNQSKYPILCKLACRYLSFPASSGPVERIFSSTGKIFRADRAKLSDQLFSKLAFLKCNKNYNKRNRIHDNFLFINFVLLGV